MIVKGSEGKDFFDLSRVHYTPAVTKNPCPSSILRSRSIRNVYPIAFITLLLISTRINLHLWRALTGILVATEVLTTLQRLV